MYFVEKIQAQGQKQRKIPVLKRFWDDFPIDSYVRVELLDNPELYFVDFVQAQGKLQRRIPVPQKFWRDFNIGDAVRVQIIKRGDRR